MTTTPRRVIALLTLVGGLMAASALAPRWTMAAPVIWEATGANPAAIQAAVDAFRTDLGTLNPNTAGSVGSGRREINWDGVPDGFAAPNNLPLDFFNVNSPRGAVFATPGTAVQVSADDNNPTVTPVRGGHLNATYPTIFQTFSPQRLFYPLGSNVVDVLFFVPGSTTRAAVTGFGAVFTDVDSSTSTRIEYFGPGGELLLERLVQATAGDASLSFLGVSFNAGELIGRVRITSGNTTLGPNDTAGADVVVMDDFIYGEPVATAGLVIAPGSGAYFQTEGFDLMLSLVAPAGVTITSGKATFDGTDVTAGLPACLRPGTVPGGQTFRCPGIGGLLSPGSHTFALTLNLSNGTSVRNAVTWQVIANTEP